MTIQDIKSSLSIQTVLNHYHLTPDKNNRLICPWHNDKTPSLQVYPNTNSWTCFSSNCQAGSGDQIDMIRLQEQCTEHEAILKAKVLAGHEMIASKNGQSLPRQSGEKSIPLDDRIRLLSRAFNFYTNALKQTKSAVAYLESRKLWNGSNTPLDIGFNGGRFHYRGKLTEAEKQQWIGLGMMKAIGSNNTYRSWAKDCVIFPLKNATNQIISFYGRSITNNEDQRHYYHKDRQGLYPHYPRPGVKRIILTEAVIDAVSLIIADVPTEELDVLACFGTKGLMAEHIRAIEGCTSLQEIIFFFDGDQAGIKEVDKYAKQLSGINKSLIISKVNTPEGEDVNSLYIGHEPAIFTHLIENRTVLFMADGQPSELFSFSGKNNGRTKANGQPKEIKSELNTTNPEHLIYQTEAIKIHIWGGIDQQNLGRLKVSLHVERSDNKTNSHRLNFRDEVNLYSFSQVKRITSHISEALEISSTYISEVIADLTQQLEAHRLSQKAQQTEKNTEAKNTMTKEENKAAMQLLSSPNLMRKTLQLIEQAGLVGQQKNGMLLFLLYLSRYFDEPLHAIIFGKSGSGKTYLQTKISECVPPEDIRVVTSLTENTLYYSPKDFWKHKILIIEDLEGVYQAFLPLREMMSKQEISKFTTDKDSQGNNIQKLLKVVGPVCVSGATTQTWIYEDNANRCFLLVIDESQDHLEAVMNYQRKKYAGLIDTSKQEKTKQKLQNAQRLLRPIKVVNPYSQELILPEKIFKKLRTNTHYLELIKIITFYCQYSKEIKIDNSGHKYIEASIEDIEWANRLVKESLLRKSDELSDKLRSFFETIKQMMRSKKESEKSFYARQIRQYLRMNPMTVNRHLRDLDMRGYISQIGGNQKTGYEYQIELWDEYEDLQKGIAMMVENLEKIKARLAANESNRVAEKELKSLKKRSITHV